MATQLYTTKENDVLDLIVFQYYGSEAVAEGTAVEYILNVNQNLSRQGVFLSAGQQVILPDLPEAVLNNIASQQVDIFDD